MTEQVRRVGDLTGRTAVVTGASSGIGLAIARRFLAAGATVHGLARRPSLIGARPESTRDEQMRLQVHAVDVNDRNAVRAFAESLDGAVDIVVLAAGVNIPKRGLEQLTPDSWDEVIGTNLSGAFYVLHAMLPRLRETQGDLVVINSVSASWPDHTGAAYQAAKAGLLGLTRGAGLEAHADGIRVCSILPGIVNTPILDRRPAPPPTEMRELFVQPEDVAEAALGAVSLPHRTNIAEMTIVATYLQSMGKTQAATPRLPPTASDPLGSNHV